MGLLSIHPGGQLCYNKWTRSLAEKVSAMIEEQALTREELMVMLRQMMEIRALENNIANLLSKAVLKGASHLYAGQEAVAVGAVAALRDDDLITSTHRGHGHAHAHGDKRGQDPASQAGALQQDDGRSVGQVRRILQGQGRFDAHRRCGTRQPGRDRHRRRQYPGGGWRGAGAKTAGHRSRGGVLLWRWRVQRRQLSTNR